MRNELLERAFLIAKAPWSYASSDIAALIRDMMAKIARSEPEPEPEKIVPAVPVSTGVQDCNGRTICLGDRIRYNLEGRHVKKEYWNPEYIVIWQPPSFTLLYAGGGRDGGSYSWILTPRGGALKVEIIG